MRPRGMPPIPRAISRTMAPVLMTAISCEAECLPKVIIEPSPNCFSIWAMASSSAFFLAGSDIRPLRGFRVYFIVSIAIGNKSVQNDCLKSSLVIHGRD